MAEQLDKDGNPITRVRSFNPEKFFAAYRAEFGALTTAQTSGLESLLSSMEQDRDISNIKQFAYMLATLKHETANTFHPRSVPAALHCGGAVDETRCENDNERRAYCEGSFA